MCSCTTALQKFTNSICTTVFSAILCYIMTSWMLVTVLNILIMIITKVNGYNEILPIYIFDLFRYITILNLVNIKRADNVWTSIWAFFCNAKYTLHKTIVIRNWKIVWKHGPRLAEIWYCLEIPGVARATLHQIFSKGQAQYVFDAVTYYYMLDMLDNG